MGKGYNNYMCKKPFHPGSKANIKRSWMAEQRTENEKKKQEDLRLQYEKEQNLYNNKALLSTESKDKLELNFMYEAPPGAKRERQKEDDEPEYKFEWQRKYNAPREDFAKGNTEIRDQPFGIPVRNVRCIKCHKWGHINTDRECPLYSQASTSSMPTTSMDPLELMRQMREDGFNLKQSVLGHHLNPQEANQQLVASDDEDDPEMQFLKNLSSKQKHKLLKKLNKLAKKQEGKEGKSSKKKKTKKSSKVKGKARKHNLDSESDSEEKKEQKRKKKTEDSPESSSTTKSSGEKSSPASEQSESEQKPSASRRKSIGKNAASVSSKSLKSESTKELEKRKNLPDGGDMSDLNVEHKSDESASTSARVKSCSPKHPDKFSCDLTEPAVEDYVPPQQTELKDSERYKGHVDDRFRNKHRHRRSPSIKQKYKSI